MSPVLVAINAVIGPAKEKEKKAVAARRERAGGLGGMFNTAPDLETFATKRVASIEGQLAAERKGTVLAGRFGPPGGGFGPPRGFGPGQGLAKPILQAADKDKDGKLSKEEMTAAVKALFKALDKDGKGEADQKAMAAGLGKLLPTPAFGGPGFPGGRPPAGFPTLSGMLAKAVVDRAGKGGKVSEAGLLAAAGKLFAEADKNKDGKLDERELAEGLNKLFLPPQFGRPGGGPFGPPGGPAPAPKRVEKDRKEGGN